MAHHWRTPRRSWTAALAAIALGTGLPPISAAAQVAEERVPITVEVRAADGGAPIAGAAVEVLAPDGARLRGAFTGPDGTVTVRLARLDSIEVSAERIGYSRGGTGRISWEDALEGVDIRLGTLPIELPAIAVSDVRRCEGEPPDGARLWSIWSNVRTALRSALLTEEEELVRFTAETWVRDLGSDGDVQEVLEQDAVTSSRPPFHALPPEELEERGYIRTAPDLSRTYYGPDARVLLSDAFRDTHCFSLEEGEEGMVELRFTPLPGREISDIEGVMRVDEGSKSLREVIYDYVASRLPGGDLGGGHIRFRALEEGPWIVDRWSIRMPLGTSRLAVWLRDHPVDREVGGAVRSVEAVGAEAAGPEDSVAGAVRDPGTPQAVAGVLRDTGDGAPIPQGRVQLVGGAGEAAASTFSNADGEFRLEALRAGTWRLEVERIGYQPQQRELVLAEGAAESIEVRMVPDAVVLEPLVATADMAARPPRCVPQVVLGRVLDGATGEPVSGARVHLVGAEGGEVQTATAAADGRFALVTPGPGLYRLRGEAEGYAGAEGAELPLLPGDTVQVDFRLGEGDGGAPMVVTGSTRPWADREMIADPGAFFSRMVGCQEEIPQGTRFGGFLDRSTIRDWEDLSQRGALGAMLVQETPDIRSYTAAGYVVFSESPRCHGVVYVDGERGPLNTPPLSYLTPEDLEAAEVYRSPHVPREYWLPGGQPCGVLAVWTRRGEGAR